MKLNFENFGFWTFGLLTFGLWAFGLLDFAFLDFGLLDFGLYDFGFLTLDFWTLDFWNFPGVVFFHDVKIQIFTLDDQRRHSLHTDNREAVLVPGRHRRDVYPKEHTKADAGSEYVGQWQTLSRRQRLVGIRLHVGAPLSLSLSLFLSHSPHSPARALNRFVCRWCVRHCFREDRLCG